MRSAVFKSDLRFIRKQLQLDLSMMDVWEGLHSNERFSIEFEDAEFQTWRAEAVKATDTLLQSIINIMQSGLVDTKK